MSNRNAEYLSDPENQNEGKAETFFRTIAENSINIIARYDKYLRYTYINPAFEQILNISSGNCLGKISTQLDLFGDANDLFYHAITTVLNTGEPITIKISFPTQNGIAWYSFHLIPEKDDEGSTNYALAIGHDISSLKSDLDNLQINQDELEEKVKERTENLAQINKRLEEEIIEHKEKEHALKISEEKYRNLITTMEEGVWVIDRAGQDHFRKSQNGNYVGLYGRGDDRQICIFFYG